MTSGEVVRASVTRRHVAASGARQHPRQLAQRAPGWVFAPRAARRAGQA
ncbi:hypothetical protein [Nonomuraea dietziae]